MIDLKYCKFVIVENINFLNNFLNANKCLNTRGDRNQQKDYSDIWDPISLVIYMFLFIDRMMNTLDTFKVTFSNYKMEETNVKLNWALIISTCCEPVYL